MRKIVVFSICAAMAGCTMFKPSGADSGRTSIPSGLRHYAAHQANSSTQALHKDFLEAAQFCRNVLNFYENRSTHAKASQLAVGISGAIAGAVLGPVALVSGWGVAWGALFSGLGGASSAALAGINETGLGSDQYIATYAKVQEITRAAFEKYVAAKTDDERAAAVISMYQCGLHPIPSGEPPSSEWIEKLEGLVASASASNDADGSQE